MLELDVQFGEEKFRLQFEHSLRSLSKWEEKNKKAFMASREKLPSEMIDYFQCMLLTPDVDRDVVYACTPEQLDQLAIYVNDTRSASSVPQETQSQYNPEVTTSELIYFWMTALKINWEAQDWHLSRLMMLIQITSYKQQPPKKRRPTEVMRDWREINERQKKLLGTSG